MGEREHGRQAEEHWSEAQWPHKKLECGIWNFNPITDHGSQLTDFLAGAP